MKNQHKKVSLNEKNDCVLSQTAFRKKYKEENKRKKVIFP
jgi:hypothetical protein